MEVIFAWPAVFVAMPLHGSDLRLINYLARGVDGMLSGPCAFAPLALDIGVNSRQAHKSGIHRSCKISTQDFRLVRSRWYCKRYMPFQGKELFSYGACEKVCI